MKPARVPDASTREIGSGAGSGSSAERSLRLLALLATEGRALSLADFATRLALPKGTAHRISAQLESSGFLARDVGGKSFTVGPALRRLALDTLNHGVVRGLRHGVLADLVAAVGETCNFTTLDGAQVRYLDRVEAQWPLRLTLDVGSQVPLHCTASGKLFLAQMPVAQRDVLIAQLPLTRMTPNTIVDAEALRRECEHIAAQGYACDDQEFITGLVAMAVIVPAASPGHGHYAAVAVHGPVARLTLADALARLPALKAAASRMQGLL